MGGPIKSMALLVALHDFSLLGVPLVDGLPHIMPEGEARTAARALGAIRFVLWLAAGSVALHSAAGWAAGGLAIAAGFTWLVSLACAIASLETHAEPGTVSVLTLAFYYNGGVVPAVLAPHTFAAFGRHRGRWLCAAVVWLVVKLVVLAVVLAHALYYEDYARAWACYGAPSALSEYDRGYCPQYTHAPYYDSSTVCRSTAMTGVPPTGRCCTCDFGSLPKGWHHWPAWVNGLVYALLIMWVLQWTPALAVATEQTLMWRESLPRNGK